MIHELTAVAAAAARAGGKIIINAEKVVQIRQKSTATDPVTAVDLAAESTITGMITMERPDDGILGEEGADRDSRSGLRWVIDPVDGTTNLLYDLPHVTVSVACQQRDTDGTWRTVAGAVHDPYRDELFTAGLGHGAFRNGERLTVNDPVPRDRALIATGFAYTSERRTRQAAILTGLLGVVRDLRSHGSAALELCWLAAGRCDAYYEDDLAPWDFAAGALIAAEAGAVVTPLAAGVLAAGPALHPALKELIA
ncbi:MULTISPECIES: inositol monophosphatase family protein [Actinoplanes]|uniref:inositol monophosphatase family protein n=1 Tax=Actinoplanes TaxID=1865 RepID=UPI0005F2844F|nr:MULTISPECIES: inositol monophosphatase family protein [Actinoplanes]GLY06967.1 inositol monophosphatase [Actinoplanes sp. NBRC 101535]